MEKGIWFNNYLDFESKKKGDNRLILNFYYIPAKGEKARSEKIYCKTTVDIPTEIITEEEAEDIREKLLKNPVLINCFKNEWQKIHKDYPRDLPIDKELLEYFLEEKELHNNRVITIRLPKNNEYINQLPKRFQKGSYNKLLKLSGFYPERKVLNDSINRARFEKKLEEIIKNNRECDLNEIEDFLTLDFLTEEEIRISPWIYFDIEKPLWKKDEEKKLIDKRIELIKEDKIYQKRKKKFLKYAHKENGEYASESSIKRINKIIERSNNRSRRINHRIKTLEDKLTIEVEGVGKVGLYEERFDAKISSLAAIWENCNGEETQIKEVYLWDPNSEFKKEYIQDYKVFTFKTEKELLEHFTKKIKERKPLFYSGHNEVYDVIQIKLASNDYKVEFNPVIEGVKPQRDFVRYFCQRLKQDGIYLDSMWLARKYDSYLGQRSMGTNFKLASVANKHGSDFEKSLTHEQLRYVEIQRIAGKTLEIRQRAADAIFSYVCGDVEPVRKIIQESNYISLLVKQKAVQPWITLTQAGFSSSSTTAIHDKKHFEYASNHRNWGYKQKERENQLQIFDERFHSLKNKMMNWAEIDRFRKKGYHKNVFELYLPFEEWTKESIFRYSSEIKAYYNSLNEDEKFSGLHDIKAFQREMLVDYYFARREKRIFRDYKPKPEKYKEIETIVDNDLLDSFAKSFHFLKNHFRSIYVALPGDKRALLRDKRKQDLQPTLFEVDFPIYPIYMKHEANLFLLRKNANILRNYLNEFENKNLASFLKNFKTFEEIRYKIGKHIGYLDSDGQELAFLYLCNKRKENAERVYYGKYKQDIGYLTSLISSAYKNLAIELDKYHCSIVDKKGDYIFVKGDQSLKQNNLWHVVRELEEYEVE